MYFKMFQRTVKNSNNNAKICALPKLMELIQASVGETLFTLTAHVLMMLWSRFLDLLVKTPNVLKNSSENLFRETELVIPSKDQLLR